MEEQFEERIAKMLDAEVDEEFIREYEKLCLKYKRGHNIDIQLRIVKNDTIS